VNIANVVFEDVTVCSCPIATIGRVIELVPSDAAFDRVGHDLHHFILLLEVCAPKPFGSIQSELHVLTVFHVENVDYTVQPDGHHLVDIETLSEQYFLYGPGVVGQGFHNHIGFVVDQVYFAVAHPQSYQVDIPWTHGDGNDAVVVQGVFRIVFGLLHNQVLFLLAHEVESMVQSSIFLLKVVLTV